MPEQNIRQIIKDELKKRQWSIYHLCKESGVSYQVAHPYLAGHTEITLPKLQKIMDVLELAISPIARSRPDA